MVSAADVREVGDVASDFLATKMNLNQIDIYDQHDHNNHEYDIGSALNFNPRTDGGGGRISPLEFSSLKRSLATPRKLHGHAPQKFLRPHAYTASNLV